MSETPEQKAYRLGIGDNIKKRNERMQAAIPNGQIINDPKTGQPIKMVEMKNQMSRRELRRQKTKKFQKEIRRKFRVEAGKAKAKKKLEEKENAMDN